MTTQSTSLLGLALPITGELDGVWGDVVNDSITSLVDSAIAGATTLTVDADVTLSTTTLAANQARQAIILWTASGTVTRYITAPASSKAYIVINSTVGTQSIVVRGAGPTTGVTIPAGGKAIVAWNGSDFVKTASNPAVLTTDVTGTLPVANGGTGLTTTPANGQIDIGNGTGFTRTTLTAGSNVTITNAAGSITIDSVGGGGTTASGSVTLTSASVAAQAITTTTYGQTVTLPDATTVAKGGILYNISNLGAYPLKIVNYVGSTLGFVYSNGPVTVGLADNSTAAGTWSFAGAEPFGPVALTYSTDLYAKGSVVKTVVIDANRTLMLIGSTNIYGIIYDSSTKLWGSLTLIRTGTVGQVEAILSATNQVLVNSSITTAMEAVVLTLSGTSITVGAAATATLSASNTNSATGGNLIAVGSSFVITYTATTSQMRAMTISGTTVAIGAATVLNGTALTAIYVTAVSSTVVLVLTNTTASTFFATPYTVSSTSISLGTGATYASTTASSYRVRPISSGARTAVVIASGGSAVGLIISVTGTTASISSATLTAGGGVGNDAAVIVSGSKLIFLSVNGSGFTNILTDTAGTASAGTPIGPFFSNISGVIPVSADATSNLATFYAYASTTTATKVVIDFTGSSPVLSDIDNQTAAASNFAAYTALNYKQTFTPDFFIGATSYVWDVNVAGQRAVAVGENSFYSFAPKFISIGGTNTSITQNKIVAYSSAYSGGVTYGALQIIESVS
jgi:hypothetical protein